MGQDYTRKGKRNEKTMDDFEQMRQSLYDAVSTSPIGGEFLTDCMMKSLESKGVMIKPRYSFKRKEIRPADDIYPREKKEEGEEKRNPGDSVLLSLDDIEPSSSSLVVRLK
ncbi:hypothetical protein MUK42_16434 [Musa troglodytarum]|uniref:Uncharacterized protein n=1 Tax=Musa troglodytarum TaxID=320322 RepID=A0A9E7KL36_9LILI|nr:hypothetical protein MUK42_16434 [Musa troglodytarum]